MSDNSCEPSGQPLYHIPLPPYSATDQRCLGQATHPPIPSFMNEAPILPDEPPPPYEACFPPYLPQESTLSSPPPPYTSTASLTPVPKGRRPVPLASDGSSSSEPEPDVSPRGMPGGTGQPTLLVESQVDVPRQLVLSKVVLRLRYYQFLLGIVLASVGVVGIDLHYFGSQYAIGIYAGLLAMVAIAWTDPRRRLFCFRDNARFHDALYLIVNGVAFVASLFCAVFYSYGLHVDSAVKRIDNSKALVNEGIGVGSASLLMVVILFKWIKTKSLTDHTVTPNTPPSIHLPPLPTDIIKLNLCIVFFCCVTMFSVGACGVPWRVYGYKLGVPFICSGVAFLTLVYCGDPRSKVRGDQIRTQTIFKIVHTLIISLAAYYICLHSYGISVDLSLMTRCAWNSTYNITSAMPSCDLPNSLSDAPENIEELHQRILIQSLGIVIATVMILTHLLKWAKLKFDHNML
ncbi:uncharacterized protein LOC135484896 [Lineus longissimus]|uniref:uncharacterized protein LOC135484896 n=1 Tax=Lineus longissimus TaxID=88925 RepID=UPI002B4C7DAB